MSTEETVETGTAVAEKPKKAKKVKKEKPAPTPKKAAPVQKQSATTSKSLRRAAETLKFVSDPTRLSIMLMLADGERNVGSMCSQLDKGQPAVSHHLALLRHGGVVETRRDGKNNYYGLTETGSALASVAANIVNGD